MVDVLLTSLLVLAGGVVEGPEPEDVKAGWGALGIFVLLIAAVALLGFSLSKQLRKAQSAKDAGIYGDPPPARDVPGDPASGAGGSTGAR